MSADLLPLLQRFPGQCVWVVGDVMLDEYFAGAVERISPEAPVPVVRVKETEQRLGGAANVARQAAALGAQVCLAGTIGTDAAGEQLRRMCMEAGIDTRALIMSDAYCTTRKLRIIGQSQQLLRLDWEEPRACTAATARDMLARLESTGINPDVMILSDYAKGVLTPQTLQELLRFAKSRCPVVVDPKQRDFSRYRGATAITPNLRELQTASTFSFDATDTAAVTRAAGALAATSECEAVVVTLGERGMLVVDRTGEATPIPAVQREVFDVTGAGDTVVGVLALSLAAKASMVDAARLANVAAGISVGQVGTYAVGHEDIRLALADNTNTKILTRAELRLRAASWRLAGKRIVFTNGCFDVLHSGHVSLLNGAARLGDVLVLAINSDNSIRRLKGPDRPLVSQVDRAALLSALACVDAVSIFDEDTPLETIECVRPQVLVKGQDYAIDAVVGREFVESIGGRVELVPLVPERSTSALVEKIRGIRRPA